MSEEARPDWVGQRAVAWVIDDAPVPSDLAWTLAVIARRCDENGKGSYQSTPTIAEKTGKSQKQAQRDIVRLRELGLLTLGDQSLVQHLPPGRRPTVYDVPLHLKGPKPAKESRNKGGGKKPPADTPPMDAAPPLEGRGPLEGGSTPPMHGGSTPPMEGSQTTPMNNPVEQPRKREMPAKRTSRQKADDEGWRMLTVLRDYNPKQARYLIDALNEKLGIYSANWWKEAHHNGSLDERIQEVIDEYAENEAARSSKTATGRAA